MIAVIPVQAGEKEVNLMPSSELRAGDWVAAKEERVLVEHRARNGKNA